MKLGLISDTHGTLPHEVFDHFQGVHRILHAGDIGPPDILVDLEAIAPVTAVYGNTDGFEIRERVANIAELDVDGRRVTVTHGHQLGSPEPDGLRAALPDADIIVYGHTHRPRVDRDGGALVVNPGSAGAPRYGFRPSVAILTLTDDLNEDPDVELIEL